MERLLQDARHAIKVLLKNPGFTLVALIVMALGIGANTAMFSIIRSVLLRPLPFKEPDRIMLVWGKTRFLPQAWLSPSQVVEVEQQSSLFEGFVSLTDLGFDYTMTGRGEPEELSGVGISSNGFSILGVSPLLGRGFLPGDGKQGGKRVVVLSHRLWQSRFNADPNVVGQELTLDGDSYSVAGVMPPGFRILPPSSVFPSEVDLWAPIEYATPEGWQLNRRLSLHVLAKLKPGVTLAQAQGELASIARRIEETQPDLYRNQEWDLFAVSFGEQVLRGVRPALHVLFGAVVFLLLIACANVSSLLLARAVDRQKEMAIRAALGATRWRLIRQMLAESLLLALTGGALGLLLAWWSLDLLIALVPAGVARIDETSIDAHVLAFTLGISLLTVALSGLVPALRASRIDLNESLKEGGKGSTGSGSGGRLRSLLVVSEIALAFVLLAGAGLMIKTYLQLLRTDPGFDPENVLTLRLKTADYEEPHRMVSFYEQTVAGLEQLPGVRAVGGITQLPLSGTFLASSFNVNPTSAPSDEGTFVADLRVVLPGYFNSMSIQLAAGRLPSASDNAAAPFVAIIDERLGRRLWPGEDPLGKRLHWVRADHSLEVVGVVKQVRHYGLSAEPKETVYIPYAQSPRRSLFITIRADGDPSKIIRAVEAAIWAIDDDVAISNVRTMEQAVGDSIGQPRLNLLLLTIFSALALVLAAVGTYGVMAYSINRRAHEIGVRLALGAQRTDLLKMVFGQAIKLAGAGIAIGLAAALALTRLMSGLLYNVSATDPTTFIEVAAVLACAAVAACLLPARRATKIDPIVALRHD